MSDEELREYYEQQQEAQPEESFDEATMELMKLIKATTGLELDEPALRDIANNITTLRRLINIDEGWNKEYDMLPPRLLEEPIDGNRITKEELDHMLQEYYQLRGWDEDGIPLKEVSIE